MRTRDKYVLLLLYVVCRITALRVRQVKFNVSHTFRMLYGEVRKHSDRLQRPTTTDAKASTCKRMSHSMHNGEQSEPRAIQSALSPFIYTIIYIIRVSYLCVYVCVLKPISVALDGDIVTWQGESGLLYYYCVSVIWCLHTQNTYLHKLWSPSSSSPSSSSPSYLSHYIDLRCARWFTIFIVHAMWNIFVLIPNKHRTQNMCTHNHNKTRPFRGLCHPASESKWPERTTPNGTPATEYYETNRTKANTEFQTPLRRDGIHAVVWVCLEDCVVYYAWRTTRVDDDDDNSENIARDLKPLLLGCARKSTTLRDTQTRTTELHDATRRTNIYTHTHTERWWLLAVASASKRCLSYATRLILGRRRLVE